MVWCDIYDPDQATLKPIWRRNSGSNDWAVEDAVAEAERTKAAVYRTHTFFTVYSASCREPLPTTPSRRWKSHRISGFVLPQGLITVRLSPQFDIDAFRSASTSSADRSTGWARWCMACSTSSSTATSRPYRRSTTVSRHSRTTCSRTTHRGAGCSARLFGCVKILSSCDGWCCRCARWSTLFSTAGWTRRPAPELDPLYVDLYDHVLRVSEWTESLRDMVTTVFETNLSLQDARLNQVMKKLTGWAAIIAVPTAITGFYGQNVNYPGLETVGGFVTSTAMIVLLVLVLYWMFKRRDWL